MTSSTKRDQAAPPDTEPNSEVVSDLRDRTVDDGPEAGEESTGNLPGMTEKDKTKALGEVYTEATRLLREHHLDEFNSLRQKLAAERGITWAPRPTAKQKALAQMKDLMAQHGIVAEELGLAGGGE